MQTLFWESSCARFLYLSFTLFRVTDLMIDLLSKHQCFFFFDLFSHAGSPGDDLGDKSRRELSPRHNADALPSLPPKPNEKFKGDEQVECICILKESDSGFDSSESSDILFSDRETTPNSERYLYFHFVSEN